jgi:hypothetical protein
LANLGRGPLAFGQRNNYKIKTHSENVLTEAQQRSISPIIGFDGKPGKGSETKTGESRRNSLESIRNPRKWVAEVTGTL